MAIEPHSGLPLGMSGPARSPLLFRFIHSLETSVLTFAGVADRRRGELIFLRRSCLSASVIGTLSGSPPLHVVINISLGREGSNIVPRDYADR